MCLIIDKGEKIKTARADITCYKVLKISTNLRSAIERIVETLEKADRITEFGSAFHCGYIYTKGVVAETKISKLKPDQNFAYFDDKESLAYGNLYEMYHSLNSTALGRELILSKFDVYSEGFHSASTIERVNNVNNYDCFNEVICECTIPKGSKYLLNKSELLISNKLVVNKIVRTNLELAKKRLENDNQDID